MTAIMWCVIASLADKSEGNVDIVDIVDIAGVSFPIFRIRHCPSLFTTVCSIPSERMHARTSPAGSVSCSPESSNASNIANHNLQKGPWMGILAEIAQICIEIVI